MVSALTPVALEYLGQSLKVALSIEDSFAWIDPVEEHIGKYTASMKKS